MDIPWDFTSKAVVRDEVAYFKIEGASRNQNFRLPQSYVFVIFEQCKGTHSIDFTTYKEKNLQIHISFPGQIRSWNTGECAIGHKLIIKKELVERLLFDSFLLSSKSNRIPIVDITKQIYGRIFIELGSLSRELESCKPDAKIIEARTQLILRLIDRELGKELAKEKRRLPSLLQNFYNLVDEHFILQKNTGFYAEKLAVSSGHLATLCREHLGQSAKEIIDQRVLLEAKRHLLGTTYSIKEITYLLDFNCMSRFAIFIKTKTGYYPKEFRNRFIA